MVDPTYGKLHVNGSTVQTTQFFFAEYVEDLIRETVSIATLQSISTSQAESTCIPPALCSQYEKPDMEEAVTRHRSRFQIHSS